jgi:ornithine carbamoyltransferase
MSETRRHLVSLTDLSDEDIQDIIAHAVEYGRGTDARDQLKGRIVCVYFRKTSTRTRTAFSVGALRLGASVVSYGPQDLQENTGESVEDTARVLSSMLDAFVARTAAPTEELRKLAAQQRMSVINAMTTEEHPTQALADLAMLLQRFGRLEGLRILYIGEGNNTAAALALAVTRVRETELFLRMPPGYGLGAEVMCAAGTYASRHNALLNHSHDVTDLPGSVDVIYTTRWQTTGTTKSDPKWRTDFLPFRVSETLMRSYPRAIFMHDLPAHRGDEVDAAVLDGPQSVAFEQAEYKLFGAMAVLRWCIVGR